MSVQPIKERFFPSGAKKESTGGVDSVIFFGDFGPAYKGEVFPRGAKKESTGGVDLVFL
jgi:hypothetical protein